jgi:glycosyltransferase involved in cell wall biosynthesis
MKLSILVPTINKRLELLKSLLNEFEKQIGGDLIISKTEKLRVMTFNDVEILIYSGDSETIGNKRNYLMQSAKGEYLCFFDDDDMPSEDYIKELLKGIESVADCISLRGIMTTNGSNPEVFEHSLKYKSWRTTKNEIKYERYPNHLNCIKSNIAKQIKFPEINHGEDYDWSKKLHESGLLKSEYYTDKVLYHYKFVTNK